MIFLFLFCYLNVSMPPFSLWHIFYKMSHAFAILLCIASKFPKAMPVSFHLSSDLFPPIMFLLPPTLLISFTN